MNALSTLSVPFGSPSTLHVVGDLPTIRPQTDGSPRPYVMGLPFDPLTLDQAVEQAERAMAQREPRFWATANLDFAAQASTNPELKGALLAADRVLADGQPLVWMSRLLGAPLPERVAGSDLTPRLLQRCARLGHSVYLFGGDEDTLQRLQAALPTQFPGLKIAGAEAPPVGEITSWRNADYTARMRSSGARLLLVALGCPKQELWLQRFHAQAGIPLAIGIGASLDFLVGTQVRAPRWMQKTGLEWAWRLLSQPQRLAQRYARDFGFLLRRGAQELCLLQAHKAPAQVDVIPGPRHTQIAQIVGNLDHALSDLREKLTAPAVLLDGARISHLGAVGMGALLQWAQASRRRGERFCVVRPSAALRQALELAGNAGLIPVAASFNDAFRQLGDHRCNGRNRAAPPTMLLHLNEPLTAAALDHLEAQVAEVVPGRHPATRFLLGAQHLTSLDAAAVRRLLLLRENLLSRGMEMFLEGCSPRVADTLALFGVADYLLARPINRTAQAATAMPSAWAA